VRPLGHLRAIKDIAARIQHRDLHQITLHDRGLQPELSDDALFSNLVLRSKTLGQNVKNQPDA
jgi:hypothetical protein